MSIFSQSDNTITWWYAIAEQNKWGWNNQNRLQFLINQMKAFIE